MANAGNPEESGTRGPSYWDVEHLHDELCRRYNCRIEFRAGLAFNKWAQCYQWHVAAIVFRPTDPKGHPGAARGYPFRGRSGAVTMPMAMHMALTGVWEMLEETEQSARDQAMF